MKAATMILVSSGLLASAMAISGWLVPGSLQALEPGWDRVVSPLATPRLSLPARPSDAPSGREVLEAIRGSELEAVEKRLLAEVLAGNVPASLRELVPVQIGSSDEGRMTIWVTPDYLSVGSDEDHFRVRLRAPAAERLVRALGAVLPTPTIVDAIHRAAPVKLPPQASSEIPEGPWVAQAVSHDRLIDEMLAERGVEPGTLIAGHMKDIVIAPALARHPDKIAIYGMHEPNGEPIQPLGLTHGLGYVDYSHGVRPVADRAQGVSSSSQRSVSDALQDPEQASALSPEGPIDLPAYPSSFD